MLWDVFGVQRFAFCGTRWQTIYHFYEKQKTKKQLEKKGIQSKTKKEKGGNFLI